MTFRVGSETAMSDVPTTPDDQGAARPNRPPRRRDRRVERASVFELAKQFAIHRYDLLLVAEPEGLDAAAAEIRKFDVVVDTLGVDLRTKEGIHAVKAAHR